MRAIEHSREIGEDIFIYQHCYKSGMEFSLSLKEGGIFAARISMKQLFATEEQALRYKEKFEKQYNRLIFVKKKTHIKNGYKIKEGYILCFA